jgi:hypothetical protein
MRLCQRFCLALFAIVLSGIVIATPQLELQWNYPTNGITTNLSFLIYESSSLLTNPPPVNWIMAGVVSGTDGMANVNSEEIYTFQLIPTNMVTYYCVVASNQWGTAVSSNSLEIDPVIQSIQNLEIIQ